MSALFATLPESRPAGRRRSPANAVASIVLHAAAVTLAVAATATADSVAPPEPDRHTDVIWIEPTTPPSPSIRSTLGGRPSSSGHRSARATPTVLPSTAVPTFDPWPIPPLPVTGGGIGERWSTSEGAPGGGPGGSGTSPGDDDGGPQVEVAAALRGTVAPRYPAPLRDQGLEGRVTLRFVVDTTGRVEPASVRVVSSTHDLFAAAARATIPTLRFTPATAAGRHVRQLVELPFTFELRR